MKIRHVLTGITAAAMLLIGAGTATAQAAVPNIGSLGCTSSSYFHQETRYHGTICYTNTGEDDLHTSDFWTKRLKSGSNTGFARFYDAKGTYWEWDFTPNQTADFTDTKVWPSGVVALDYLYIASN